MIYTCITKFGWDLMTENSKYHILNDIKLTENVFRPGSSAFNSLLKEARQLYNAGHYTEYDEFNLLKNTDLGIFENYNGEEIPLDLPMLNEAEYKGKDVDLNKPMRNPGKGKKYKVYVKNDNGNIIVVYFGDMKGGLTAKINDPEARAAFVARHKCDTEHKDKTKPGYWSCRLPAYAHLLGLKPVNARYW